jgi:hypothetical protein
MSFGFDKIKKQGEPAERALDLSGLNLQPPIVPPVEKEKKALAKGEALGFSSREAADPERRKGSVVRRRQKTATRSLYIQGPASVLDRFVTYTNQLGVDAYWQALEKLLTEKGK